MTLTPAEARRLLRDRADRELPEERPDPPYWSPFAVYHPIREIRAAASAARTRVEHALRLADEPDVVLAELLARGWHPQAVAKPGYAVR